MSTRKEKPTVTTFAKIGVIEDVSKKNGRLYLQSIEYTEKQIQAFLNSWKDTYKFPGEKARK